MNSRTNEISPVNFGYKKKSKSGTNINGIYRKDLSRFVKWPKYIRIQRQRRIFCQKLKIPPAIFQFSKTLDKNMSSQLFQLLSNYRRTESVSKHNMFKSKIKNSTNKDLVLIRHGINTVAKLVKNQKALFVLIANDVNPIDCVVWLPTLCTKMNIPYCIVKSKSKLGALVNRKKTSCICITYIHSNDNENFQKLLDCFRKNFNDRYSDAIKRWSEKKP